MTDKRQEMSVWRQTTAGGLHSREYENEKSFRLVSTVYSCVLMFELLSNKLSVKLNNIVQPY